VLVLRRRLPEKVAAEKSGQGRPAQQINPDLPEAAQQGVLYEYAVLVTALPDQVRTSAQHDRDRGDSENNFDGFRSTGPIPDKHGWSLLRKHEWKNQGGWAGFTTHDRKRCQTMARSTALIYHGWTIFMRLGIPGKHAQAITSRPLALHGIARRTRHSNQTTVEVTSTHAKALVITQALTKVSKFLKRIRTSAEQFAQPARWRLILRAAFQSAAFQYFLRGRVIGSSPTMAELTR
jgi:hypothetical protein